MFKKVVSIDGFYYNDCSDKSNQTMNFIQVAVYQNGKTKLLNTHTCKKEDYPKSPSWVFLITNHNRLLDC